MCVYVCMCMCMCVGFRVLLSDARQGGGEGGGGGLVFSRGEGEAHPSRPIFSNSSPTCPLPSPLTGQSAAPSHRCHMPLPPSPLPAPHRSISRIISSTPHAPPPFPPSRHSPVNQLHHLIDGSPTEGNIRGLVEARVAGGGGRACGGTGTARYIYMNE